MAEEIVLDPRRLRDYATSIFEAAGVSREDAEIAATIQVEADLRGVHTHGVAGIIGYAPQLRSGRINPRPSIRVVKDDLATALIDGDNGLGQVVAYRSMWECIARAQKFGIGAVTTRGSNHFGAAAYYAMMALDHHLIGFATTSAGARMAAWGGTEPVVGNNPVAWAIPAGRELPIVLDMAQSVVAAGKIGLALRKGETIPPGWALDREGRPTTDPLVGLEGLLVPIAGPKGFGLAVVSDVLSGVLSGGTFGIQNRADADGVRRFPISHFFMAIDVARFMDFEEFTARVDRMIDDIHRSKRAEGVDQLYLPGEIEFRRRAERLERGVPLLESIVVDLEKVGRELGVNTSLRD